MNKYVVVVFDGVTDTMIGVSEPFDSHEAADSWANKTPWIASYEVHEMVPPDAARLVVLECGHCVLKDLKDVSDSAWCPVEEEDQPVVDVVPDRG